MSIRTIESSAQGTPSNRTSGTARAKQARSTRVLTEITSPWIGRQSPCTAAEEADFVTDLEHLCIELDAPAEEFERRDVTVLLTALRGGLTVRQLLAQAPGVDPSRLLAAHHELENRRVLSEHAWRTISLDPRPEVFRTFAACAAELLPAVISHLAAYHYDGVRLSAAIDDATEAVLRTSRRVLVLEQRLTESATDPQHARELGTLLYDVYGQGAWSLPTFLPPRVGALVPLRVGALLGDDVATARRAS